MLGPYIIPGVVLLAILGAFVVHDWRKDKSVSIEQVDPEKQTFKGVILRTVKIFAFIVALELLGAGFRPFIDRYIVMLTTSCCIWSTWSPRYSTTPRWPPPRSARRCTPDQIKTILMSLLISGGMLITGNIPNIVTAGRLKIQARTGRSSRCRWGR